MLKIAIWATEKPKVTRIFAISLAISAIDCFEILNDVKDNNIPEQYKIPECPQWFKFYYSHRYLQRHLINIFSQSDGFPGIYSYIFKKLTKRNQIQSHEETNNNFATISIEEIFENLISYIKDDIKNTPLNEKERDTVRDTIISPEFLFLMKVTLPCWLLYNENCARLLRKAMLGDSDSLEKLLRLDKSLVQHPRINQWITHYSFQKDKRIFENLTEAIKNPPRAKVTLAKVKYCFAGFISYLTELLKNRLSAPDIQNLFDAVAIDYGYDALRDPDLPDSPEAFAKAVQRERSFWKTAFPA
jgi:hypothetical protein